MPIIDYDDGSRVLDGVPIYYQGDTKRCGHACTASVLAYFGYNVTFEDIIDQTSNTAGALGMSLEQIVWTIRKYGLQARTSTGKLQDLKTQINRGSPIIVAFDELSIQHVVVVVGYNDEKELIFYNDSDDGFTIEEPYSDFIRAWSRKRANSSGFFDGSLANMMIQISR
jgi:ABC-type bacteriocin/lantibiotic exporter with double-glycine peptidase domain